MANIGDRIGSYILEKLLGSGGFGDVWLADNPQDLLYQKVAIKLAKSQHVTLEKIKSEALLWRSVSGNENIIPFIEAKNFDGQIIIVSEFADGGSLQDYLDKNGGKIGIPETESILRDILNGLEHLHSKGIGHFDLKPANILIKGDKICLADFGLSKTLVTENTSRGAGTLSYSPPELFDNKRTLQSDIWSVGVILQRMLTGKMPFEGETQHALIFSIIQNEPQPLPDEIPPLYRNLISKCLQKDIKKRFQTLAEMREALKNPSFNNEPPIVQPVLPRDTIIDPDPIIEIVSPSLPQTLTNSIGMEFVKIPVGAFMMGSTVAEQQEALQFVRQFRSTATLDWFKFESPQRQVTIGSEFYLGKYEVTQAEYRKVMGRNPSHFKTCPRCPVEQVSWNDAKEFIKRLNAQNDGYEYRLPSEAEWEYAARGGKVEQIFGIGNGNSISSWQANFDGNYPFGGAEKGNYLKQTTEVGSYPANAFGLYDMHGNVWEWCEDIYKDNYFGLNSDGSANVSLGDSNLRILRGGSWYDNGIDLRSAFRSRNSPASLNNFIGFRVATRVR